MSMSSSQQHFAASMRLPLSSSSPWNWVETSWLSRPIISTKIVPPVGRLIIIGAIVSMSGLLYGLDTGSIGPLTELESFSISIGRTLSPSLHGFFVASILLSASISSLCSGYVADRISRRIGVATGALIVTLGTIISACCSSLAALFVARIITGLGAGQTISVASLYLIEIATPDVRGKLACMVQFSITIGVMTGYFITYGSQRIQSSLSWRLPFIVQAVCSFFLAICIFAFVPFSPRWQLQQGREEQALQTLRTLRISPNVSAEKRIQQEQLVQHEIVEMRSAIARSQALNARGSVGYVELLQKPYRKRVLLGVALMAFQQLSGVDVILYFAPIVFSSLFSSQTASFLASGVTGIVLVVSTIPAQIYVDRWGRKPMMVAGGAAMATCFLVIGSLFAKFASTTDGRITLQTGVASWFVVILIYVFVGVFSMTWAVCTRVYSVEIIPTRLRSRAAAVQQLANWMTNFAVALTAPSFLAASPSGPYFFFAGCLTLATMVCVYWMRETKGKSLEQIDELFEARTA